VRVLAVTNLRAPFVKKQVESLRRIGIEMDLLEVDRTYGGRRVYATLARRVQQVADEWRPDLVHVIYGGVMADVVTRRVAPTPVAVTFCGSDLVGGDEGHRLLKRLNVRYGVAASRRAARRARSIILESTCLLPALPSRIDSSRVWIVPDGVDLALFRPLDRSDCRQRLGWDQHIGHVIFPAPRTRREKRFELAQAAVERLEAADARVQLHELADVPHEEVPLWLNAADAVVLTSTHEGSPNVIKEALACNVAVVSVDVGDVGERIEGVAGCFLAEATPDDLADKLRRTLGVTGRIESRAAVQQLELGRIAERLEGVYAATVADRDPSTGP
jgi:glycosyltransferase involved in cell wall biosynthesis